jgi:HSP20 family protein
MPLLRRQPSEYWWNGLERLQDEMNRLFERYDGQGASQRQATYPPLNVWEDADHVYVEAELPGMNMEETEIYVTEGNRLALRGVRKPVEAENGVWHRQERGFGAFERVLTLPVAVEPDRVEARFEQGVLHIKLPKTARAKPRRIKVAGG